MWGWLTCECWCCGLGGFAASFLSLFVFLCVNVVSTLSSGYVRAPLPYRLVNAGLFDYKKKKKKKKKTMIGTSTHATPTKSRIFSLF